MDEATSASLWSITAAGEYGAPGTSPAGHRRRGPGFLGSKANVFTTPVIKGKQAADLRDALELVADPYGVVTAVKTIGPTMTPPGPRAYT